MLLSVRNIKIDHGLQEKFAKDCYAAILKTSCWFTLNVSKHQATNLGLCENSNLKKEFVQTVPLVRVLTRTSLILYLKTRLEIHTTID